MLEDNDEIIAAFQKTIATTGDGFESKVWRNATFQVRRMRGIFPHCRP